MLRQERYLMRGVQGTEEKKVVIHLRSQAVDDPTLFNPFTSSFQAWILPELTSLSCTDISNPTWTPGQEDRILVC